VESAGVVDLIDKAWKIGGRMLFMQAARVILLRPTSWPKHGFGVWLARAAQRLHPNVLAAALANKLARIAWTVLAQERRYEARITKAAA
jgi:transposase